MFEAAEVGNKLTKADFNEREPELHTRLLEIQRELRGANFPVFIIVSGVEGAGKGRVVNRLNTWLDSRGMQMFAFWDESDEERARPRFWRFWRTLPPRGQISIMFGSWYTQPIIGHAMQRTDQGRFDHEMHRIVNLERTLNEDGALIIKLWFHLSKSEQQRRLQQDRKEGEKNTTVSPLTKKFSKRYDEFVRVSERALRLTSTGDSPWHIIEATDRRYRDLTTGTIVHEAISSRLSNPVHREKTASFYSPVGVNRENPVTVLDALAVDAKPDPEKSEKELEKYQARLGRLAWKARKQQISTIAVFEGSDAAGKGGAIRRVIWAIDARLYRVISVAAPTDEERARHYLWRFWRQLPRDGYMTIYDRSWYGRVLVERVEGFAKPHEWGRAYLEINDFEEQLCEHGIVLLKFWLHINKEEQLRRFQEREQTPWKQHKITAEDWRNREKWDPYLTAVHEMVTSTSTEYAPWNLIAANDKGHARVRVLKAFCDALEARLP